MPTTSKSSKKAKGAPLAAEITDVFTPLYLNSVAAVAELQKNSLDVVAEQSSEWIGAWKKAFGFFPLNPPTFFFDLAGQAVQTCVDTQKAAIDLVAEQAEAVTKIARQRADAYTNIAETATAAFQTTVVRTVEAQKKVLEFAGAQNKSFCQATKKQLGSPAAVVVDSFERGANTLIEAQKSVLDATTKPFVA